jgi:hypothetical protein
LNFIIKTNLEVGENAPNQVVLLHKWCISKEAGTIAMGE